MNLPWWALPWDCKFSVKTVNLMEKPRDLTDKLASTPRTVFMNKFATWNKLFILLLDLICKTCKKKKSKIKFKTTRYLANEIYSNVITLNDPFEEQIKLKNEIFNVNENSLTKNLNKKEKNYWLAETHIGLKWLQLDSNPEPLSS